MRISIATSGSITINRYEENKLDDGTFTATFGSADMTSGNYIANLCSVPTLYPNPTCAD